MRSLKYREYVSLLNVLFVEFFDLYVYMIANDGTMHPSPRSIIGILRTVAVRNIISH